MADSRNRSRPTLVGIVIGLFAVVVVAIGTRSRPRPKVRPVRQRTPQVLAVPQPQSVASAPVQAPAHTRRRGSAFLLIANLGAATSVVLAFGGALPLVGSFVLVALIISAAALRGPAVRVGPAFAVHFLIGSFSVGLVGELVVDPAGVGHVPTFLLQALFGIVAVGVLAWLASTWKLGQVVEPTALVLVAVILAWLSLQGIGALTAPIDTRQTQPGRAVLLASDPAVELRWTIWIEPEFDEVRMSISTRDTSVPADFRWAVVLMGTAQLVDIRPDVLVPDTGDGWALGENLDVTAEEVEASNRGVQVVARPPDQVNDPASEGLPDGSPVVKVVSGGLNLEGEGSFGGRPIVPLAVQAGARTAVVMPGYSLADPTHWGSLRDTIAAALGKPPARPDKVDITVDAGYAGLLRTIQNAYPPLAEPSRLLWGTEDVRNSVSFVLFDQQAEDRARNQLFVIAILLGTATSCVVAALQSALRLRPSRRVPTQTS